MGVRLVYQCIGLFWPKSVEERLGMENGTAERVGRGGIRKFIIERSISRTANKISKGPRVYSSIGPGRTCLARGERDDRRVKGMGRR